MTNEPTSYIKIPAWLYYLPRPIRLWLISLDKPDWWPF
jgi:hypothetical protein